MPQVDVRCLAAVAMTLGSVIGMRRVPPFAALGLRKDMCILQVREP